MEQNAKNDFEHATPESQGGLLSDFWYFLRYNKKWWLAPIVVIFLLFWVLLLVSGSGAAPFIYTLF
jgi:hypothetical protein